MSLRALLSNLNLDPVFNRVNEILSPGTGARAFLSGLWGSARAFVYAGLAERLQRPMLVLAPTPEDARELYEQLRPFLAHPDPERESLFLFPGREILPYERALADADLEGERLEVLLRLQGAENPVIVAALEQARERLPDPLWLLDRCLTLSVGQHVNLDRLADDLVERGYVREPMIESRGQFAFRGGIVDIFPPADLYPWRVELEGSEIVTLRRFNLGQDEEVPKDLAAEARISPARLFCPALGEVRQGLAALERRHGREAVRWLAEALRDVPAGPGLEDYLPRFLESASLVDHLPGTAVVVVESPGMARVRNEEQDLRAARSHAERARREPLLPAPEELFYSVADLGGKLERRSLLQTGRLKQTLWEALSGGAELAVVVKGADPLRGNLDLLVAEAGALLRQGLTLHLVASTAAEGNRLRQLLAERAANLDAPDLLGHFQFHTSVLSEGFQYPAARLTVFTEAEIFGRRPTRRASRRSKAAAYPTQPLASLLELSPGDLAVHRDHGIARYAGVVKLSLDGGEHEFVTLLYGGDEKLYVPVDQLRLVEKYVGGGEAPRLHRLGSSAWERAKQRVKASVTELARQLLDLYASRQVHPSHAFAPDNAWQKEFEESFAYEETPDQARAIAEVKRDLEAPRPMDRLICGDVGYGKTEVAMRAAFKAVQDGYQVAVLVPTTLLADQHYATFRSRMAAYPVRVELLSRFRPGAEQRKVLRDLAQGAVDITIGTHRLLGKDVSFGKLGLLVIDEEQHFGVAHKERLKAFRSTVDVLTLTATPIPRTLYLSLSGIRDISVIETPPLNRLAIRTVVTEFSEDAVREAVGRELARGGQVFFIHNRVQSIGTMAERIKRLVPEARVAIAHGQMDKDELEPVMERFLARAEDVLVSTTIVESGLDLPNVNTILINRADAMGLAQLYQLRGRVGRADRQAYAYLFYPQGGAVTGDAEKRLSTLQEFTALGSGFKIAMRDLEIRGSGDILGAEQSGQVAEVGFETYCSLLEEAVRELRGQRQEAPVDVKLTLPVDALLPAEYVPDTVVRLSLYKRLAGSERDVQIDDLHRELASRYGPLPEPAVRLIEAARLRVQARTAGLAAIEVGDLLVRLTWQRHRRPSEDWILAQQRSDRRVRFLPGDPAKVEFTRPRGEVIGALKNILSELS